MIDWFTVAAQTLNFIVLVWLMKRFLYKPILHAVDAREKRIAAELSDADATRVEALQQRDEFQHKNEEFDRQRAAMMIKATGEVQAERQRLLDEAGQAADTVRAKRQDALQREQERLYDEVTRRAGAEVFAIARKTLTDLAGTSLEERMSEVFARRLRELDGEAKSRLEIALKALSGPALVRSAFDLPSEQRATIQQALNETFSAEIPIRFETSAEVISGIELTASGRKVAWSIADYLVSLERSVEELLKQPPAAQPETEARVDSEPQAGLKTATPAEAT